MRVLSELIDEVKFVTNNLDSDRFTDARLLSFFNTAVQEVQKIISLSNCDTNILCKYATIEMIPNQEEYDLPTDMYANNSIISVVPVDGTGLVTGPAFDKTTSKSRRFNRGYFLMDNKIYISSRHNLLTNASHIEVAYYRRLDPMTLVTDTPELPSECERYLMLFVERKIYAIDSSSDIGSSSIFTNEEKEDIGMLFADNSQDSPVIPITDYSFFCY